MAYSVPTMSDIETQRRVRNATRKVNQRLRRFTMVETPFLDLAQAIANLCSAIEKPITDAATPPKTDEAST